MDFNLANYINDLRYLVNIDSNSLLPQGTQKIAYFFASGYEKLGFTTKYITVNDAVGPCLVITNNEANKYDLLFLSHMDTARPIGSPAITPFRIDKNIAYGPGCGDMKGCALSLLYIFKNIYRSDLIKNHNIMIVMNSDEEISSKYSCKLLKELGSKAKYAIATEAARINGDLVKERLGVARYTLNATGVAAHSGVNPQDGSSAINELASWTVDLHALTNYKQKFYLNVGKITGGIGANTIADKATGFLDVRYINSEDIQRLETWMLYKSNHPYTDGGAKVMFTGGITRPPMFSNHKTDELCAELKEIMLKQGIHNQWIKTGGGGDGCFTAMQGVPTIDGVGPIAGLEHSPREYLELNSVIPRAEMLKSFIFYILQKC